jgi:hypothetical protein
MNVFDKIIASSPIDKTAALVTSHRSVIETDIQRLKNEVNDIDAAIQNAKKRRLGLAMLKDLGVKKLAIQGAISELRKEQKKHRSTSVEAVFVDVCREQLLKHQFCLLMKEANKRLDRQ